MVAASYGLCLIFAALVGGLFLRMATRPAIVQPVNCPPGFVSANIRVPSGSYVQLVESNSIDKTRVPVVALKDVLKSFDEFPYGDFAGVLRKIKQPSLITLTNDLSTGMQLWVIAPPELATTQGQIALICGEPLSDQYPVIRVATVEAP